MLNLLIGCEESQAVALAFRRRGFNAYSCDLKPCSGGAPEFHLQMDVFTAINGGFLRTQSGNLILIKKWHGAVFFPDCTYLTCSAEWAYKEPPYHQKLKPGTLTGAARARARESAADFFLKLYLCKIQHVAVENPVGVMSTRFIPPTQIIQPYNFGNDASKKTCLWLKNLPVLCDTEYVEPRIVNGKPRWSNQTDSGQNRLSPSVDRAELRSKTFSGIAEAMATQWGNFLLNRYPVP